MKTMKTIPVCLLLLLSVLMTLPLRADDVKTVTGESTFYGESSHSLNDCKRYALEQARIAALAKEFGSLISQDIYQRDVQSGSSESNYFSMLNRTEVNGEWLADIGEPQYTVDHDADHNPIVKCVVKGKARRLTNEASEFEAEVLRNGNERRYADTRFHAGDELKLYFRAPLRGYVAVYLVDDKRNVYSLLPYLNGTDGSVRVNRDCDYIFFDRTKADPQFGTPDELEMTVDGDTERNQIYVLFSPNDFTRARDREGEPGLPRMVAYDDFTRWLTAVRHRDPKMGMKIMNLEVTKTP